MTKGVITSVTGWSISYFTDLSGQNVGAYIVKTGASPISSDACLSIGKTTGALQGTATATATIGTTTTTPVTGSNLSLVPLHLGAGFQAQGLYSNETTTRAQYHGEVAVSALRSSPPLPTISRSGVLQAC